MKGFIKKGIQAFHGMSVQVKASAAFMAVNFMQKGISFLTAPIFTRLLTTEEYGVITIYSSWLDVIGIFAMFGLYNNVYCRGILEFKEDKRNFTFSLLSLSNLITLLVFLIVWTVNKHFLHFLDVPDTLILFMFFSFLLEPAFEFWKTDQRFDYKYKLLCFFMALVMVFAPAASIAGIFLFPEHKIEARIIGAQIVTLVLSAGCYFHEVWGSKGPPKIIYWKYALAYNLPLIPYFLSSYVLSSSDRLMIGYYWGEDKAGIYGIAYTMSAVANIVWSSINATLVPTIYKRCDEGRRHTLSDLIIPIIAGYSGVCILIMLLSPEIIRFLAPSSYGEGMYIIPVIVGGVFYMSIFSIFSNIIYYEKKPKFVMGAGVAAAVLNMVLNLIFIPVLGYFAAGYTTLAAYLLQVAWSYTAVRKVTGESVYDMKRLGTIGLLVLGMSVFSPLLYPFTWIRWGLLALIFVLIWKKRELLLGGLFGDKRKMGEK
ncbi:MAG: oligosaccharide flippase family protein [Lachnospiraceae bacterium]